MVITIRKAYADTLNGLVQLHYRYAFPPPDTPTKLYPILFFHKSASSSASYESLMLRYASVGYKCFAPDMPGFGSSWDPSDHDVARIEAEGTAWYASVFMEAFQNIGIVGPCHIVGHHSGAVLAVELAATKPEFVKSICLVGPTVMSAEERAAMKEIYFKPFNEPQMDGAHLMKTWEYLGSMGVGEDLNLWHREFVDHARAWRGRTLIYGSVWAQESEAMYKMVTCPILLMCARDDVLFKYFSHIQGLKAGVEAVEITGGNFEPDRDVDGIQASWTAFIERAEKS